MTIAVTSSTLSTIPRVMLECQLAVVAIALGGGTRTWSAINGGGKEVWFNPKVAQEGEIAQNYNVPDAKT